MKLLSHDGEDATDSSAQGDERNAIGPVKNFEDWVDPVPSMECNEKYPGNDKGYIFLT